MTNPDYSAGCAFIDGAYVPIGEARIPLLDRGFTRSDVTYDVTHVWKGYIFRLDDYLDRFERNVAALRLRLPHSRAEIRDILVTCVRLSGLRDAFVQMTCTRGLTPPGSRDPRTATNRFHAFAIPFVWIMAPERFEAGLNLHLSSRRRIPPESVDPTTKNFHWLDMTMAQFDAYDAGADAPILVDGDGNLTEGPGFNIFVRDEGRLLTPESGVFDGMTRRTVIELAREGNIDVVETTVTPDRLRRASEVFLTSTAGGIMPVTRIDGVPVGDATPGPLTRRLHDTYWTRKGEGWLGEAIDYGPAAVA